MLLRTVKDKTLLCRVFVCSITIHSDKSNNLRKLQCIAEITAFWKRMVNKALQKSLLNHFQHYRTNV